MLNLKLLSDKKASSKVVILVLAALIFLTGYYITASYFDYQQEALAKLNAIAKTLSLQIDGDKHQALLNKYQETGSIASNEQDSNYYEIHKLLKHGYIANDLKSEIATLHLDKTTNNFCYVVNSSDTPYFRDPYTQYHETFYDNYTTGDIIEAYTDEYGTWLTAFSPIKNKAGEVVGIVEVDEKYDDFLHVADKKLYTHLAISLLISVVITIFLLRYVKKILVIEEEVKDELKMSYKIINERNSDILNSINYAKKIQRSILPPLDLIKENIPHSFVLFIPKDIVSGDFYFFYEIEKGKKFYIATCDCTGHGVPGALMSMIGTNLLNHYIQDDPSITPAQILNQLNTGIVNALKQDGKYGETRDGMDVALCYIDLDKNTIGFSGANRPLYILRNGKIIEQKGDKRPIGGYEHTSLSYTDHSFEIEKGDKFYLFSDGYPDQFGGTSGKKFLSKNFQRLLLQTEQPDLESQFNKLSDTHISWKGSSEQTDDVLVIGFSFSEK